MTLPRSVASVVQVFEDVNVDLVRDLERRWIELGTISVKSWIDKHLRSFLLRKNCYGGERRYAWHICEWHIQIQIVLNQEVEGGSAIIGETMFTW